MRPFTTAAITILLAGCQGLSYGGDPPASQVNAVRHAYDIALGKECYGTRYDNADPVRVRFSLAPNGSVINRNIEGAGLGRQCASLALDTADFPRYDGGITTYVVPVRFDRY